MMPIPPGVALAMLLILATIAVALGGEKRTEPLDPTTCVEMFKTERIAIALRARVPIPSFSFSALPVEIYTSADGRQTMAMYDALLTWEEGSKLPYRLLCLFRADGSTAWYMSSPNSRFNTWGLQWEPPA